MKKNNNTNELSYEYPNLYIYRNIIREETLSLLEKIFKIDINDFQIQQIEYLNYLSKRLKPIFVNLFGFDEDILKNLKLFDALVAGYQLGRGIHSLIGGHIRDHNIAGLMGALLNHFITVYNQFSHDYLGKNPFLLMVYQYFSRDLLNELMSNTYIISLDPLERYLFKAANTFFTTCSYVAVRRGNLDIYHEIMELFREDFNYAIKYSKLPLNEIIDMIPIELLYRGKGGDFIYSIYLTSLLLLNNRNNQGTSKSDEIGKIFKKIGFAIVTLDDIVDVITDLKIKKVWTTYLLKLKEKGFNINETNFYMKIMDRKHIRRELEALYGEIKTRFKELEKVFKGKNDPDNILAFRNAVINFILLSTIGVSRKRKQ